MNFRQTNYRGGFGSPGASGPSWSTGASRNTFSQGRMPWGGGNKPQPRQPGSYQSNVPSWGNSARQPQQPGSYQSNLPAWGRPPLVTGQQRATNQQAQDQAYQGFQPNEVGPGLGAQGIGAMLQQPVPPVAAPQAPLSMLEQFGQLRQGVQDGTAGMGEVGEFRDSLNPQAPPAPLSMLEQFGQLRQGFQDGTAGMDEFGEFRASLNPQAPPAMVAPAQMGKMDLPSTHPNLSPWAQGAHHRLQQQLPPGTPQPQQQGLGSPMSRMDYIQSMPMSPERRAMAKQLRQSGRDMNRLRR